MACLKSTKEKQANLFNSDNEEDERKALQSSWRAGFCRVGLGDVDNSHDES